RPLLLATGDGDFAQLVRRHPGPVLLVGSTSNRSRALAAPHITPTDPALDGGAQLRAWIATRSQRAERRIVSTLFSRIIAGEIPGRFVWRDERCVAFLTIAPLRPGHALVVPRHEVDEWTDADDDLLAHLLAVARQIGAAQKSGLRAQRAGLVSAGCGVPHLHLHAFRPWDIHDGDYHNADRDPDPAELDAAEHTFHQPEEQAGDSNQ